MPRPRRDLQPHSEAELAAVTIGGLAPLTARIELVPAVQHYADAKTAVVEEILARARESRR